jgi:hypothetical protein
MIVVSTLTVSSSMTLVNVSSMVLSGVDIVATSGSIIIPYGAAVDLGNLGEIGLDLTGGQFLYRDESDVRVIPSLQQKCMTIETPADADNFLFFKSVRAITVVGVYCVVNAATSAVVTLQECNGDGGSCGTTESLTCAATNTQSTSIDDPTVDAGDWMRLDVGTVTGTVGHVSFCAEYRETRL